MRTSGRTFREDLPEVLQLVPPAHTCHQNGSTQEPDQSPEELFPSGSSLRPEDTSSYSFSHERRKGQRSLDTEEGGMDGWTEGGRERQMEGWRER